MRFFVLREATILEVTGQDSLRYINARLTANIKSLNTYSSCYGAALTPQGKTQALFTVWRVSEGDFVLTCDAGDRDSVQQAFKKYLVADRVKVTDVSLSRSFLHLLPDENSEPLKSLLGFEQFPKDEGEISVSNCGAIATAKDRGWGNGLDLIITTDQSDSLFKFLSSSRAYEFSRNDINFARILSRIPAFPDELSESSLFSEAGFAKAVGVNKGCYVGQEVIEKVESIGRSARSLQILDLEGCPPISYGAEVLDDNSSKVGTALTSAWNPQTNRTICFVTVPNNPQLNGKKVYIQGVGGVLVWS